MTNTEDRIDKLLNEESTTLDTEMFDEKNNNVLDQLKKNETLSSCINPSTEDKINKLLNDESTTESKRINKAKQNKESEQSIKSDVSSINSSETNDDRINQLYNEESTTESKKITKTKKNKKSNKSNKTDVSSALSSEVNDSRIDQLFNEESTTASKAITKEKKNKKSKSRKDMEDRIDQLLNEESTTVEKKVKKNKSRDQSEQSESTHSSKSSKGKISQSSGEESVTDKTKPKSSRKSDKKRIEQFLNEESVTEKSEKPKKISNKSIDQLEQSETASHSYQSAKENINQLFTEEIATDYSTNNASKEISSNKNLNTEERLDQLYNEESATEIKRKTKAIKNFFVDLPKRPEIPSPYVTRVTKLEKSNKDFELVEFQRIRKVTSRKDILEGIQRIGKILNTVEPSSIPKEGLDKVCFILVNSCNNEFDYFGVGPFNDAYMMAKFHKQMGYNIVLLYNPTAQKFLEFFEFFLTYTTTSLTFYYTGKDAIANKDIDHGIYFIDNTMILQDDLSKFIFEKCHEKGKILLLSDCSSGDSIFNIDLIRQLVEDTHKHIAEIVSFSLNKKGLKPRERKLTHGLLTFYFCKFIKMYPNCTPKEVVDMLNGAFKRFKIIVTDKITEHNLGYDLFFKDARDAFSEKPEESNETEETSQTENKNASQPENAEATQSENKEE